MLDFPNIGYCSLYQAKSLNEPKQGDNKMNAKPVKDATFSVTFKVTTSEPLNFEYFLKDLLETSVLPALSAEIKPLTYEVKKGRN